MLMGGPACQSCGRPMTDTRDHAGARADAAYCHRCGDRNGALLPYETVLARLVDEAFVGRNGMERGAAETAARNALSRQPAWRGRA